MNRFERQPHSRSSVPSHRLPPIDFQALKASVSIVELLKSIGWQPSRTRMDELRGPCPIHDSQSEQSTIFSVNRSKNVFRCFKCQAGGDAITLAAYLTGIDPARRVTAAVALCRKLGITIPRLP